MDRFTQNLAKRMSEHALVQEALTHYVAFESTKKENRNYNALYAMLPDLPLDLLKMLERNIPAGPGYELSLVTFMRLPHLHPIIQPIGKRIKELESKSTAAPSHSCP